MLLATPILKFFRKPLDMWLVLCVAGVSLLGQGCIKESNEFSNVATINLTIINDLGQPLEGARILIYDNQDGFDNFAGAQDSLYTDANGFVIVELEGGKEHWVVAEYNDTIRQVFLSSRPVAGYLNPLKKGSIIQASINLEALNAYIGFYAFTNTNLPISIKIGSETYTLNTTTANIPFYPNAEVISHPAEDGEYVYQAKDSRGCIWAGKVKVRNGQYIAVNLEPCYTTRFVFVALPGLESKLPVDVYLDNNDFIGQVTASYTAGSFDCSNPDYTNTVHAIRPTGGYKYSIVPSPGSTAQDPCFWSDTLAPNIGDTCVAIYLYNCE